MITKLDVTNESILTPGVAFSPSGSAATDLIHVRDIDGLGAADADISSTAYGVVDGSLITGATVNMRNIVLTVGFNPDFEAGQTVAVLRDEVYRYFMPKSEVTLTFTRYLQPTVRITGTVERLEPNHFSDDPEVQISILCPDPNFRAIEPTVVTGKGLQASDDSVGNYSNINYAGNVPTGIQLEVVANIDHTTNGWYLKTEVPVAQNLLIWNYTLRQAEDLLFSSVDRDKYVKESGGTSLLNSVVDGGDWIKLYPGANLFAFTSFGLAFASGDAPDWTMTYYALYGGI